MHYAQSRESKNRGKVFIVDDDPGVGMALKRLFAAVGFQVEFFASAYDFLEASKIPHNPCCLVLDVKMPGLDGLELQKELAGDKYSMPIVFLTGYGDIPSSVRAMKQGAVTFLTKPVDDQVLIQAVEEGMGKDVVRKKQLAEMESIQARVDRLTDRERQILTLVIAGLLNKQVAIVLGISEKTVKAHRGRIMTKMEAGSLAELVRMTDVAGIPPATSYEL